MEKRTMKKSMSQLLPVLAAPVLIVLLSGCAGVQASNDSGAPESNEATCSNLLDSELIDGYKRQGWTEGGQQYTAKIAADDMSFMQPFVHLGGIACRWGEPDGDTSVMFAYGPITNDEAASLRIAIQDAGGKKVDEEAFERYTHPDGYAGGFAFGEGVWAYALDNNSKYDGHTDLLREVVRHAPKF
jgi:hypothetical protein